MGLILMMGCIKEEWKLNDQFEVDDFDPSFAIPLIDAHLNLGDIEREIDSESFIYNEDNEMFALVYPATAFEFRGVDMNAMEEQELACDYSLSSDEVLALNTLPAGSEITITQSAPLDLDAPNGESLDSVVFSGGQITFTIESSIPHDLEVELTIPGMHQDDQTFSEVVTIPYPGFSPFMADASYDLIGYSLDLTDGGTTTNLLVMDWDLSITSTGEASQSGDDLQIQVGMDMSQLEAVYGFIGQLTTEPNENIQEINLFRDLNNGILHFEEPRIEMRVYNSTGVPAAVDFSSVYAPENSIEQTLSGSDIENFPTILAAGSPGEVVMTEHLIDNDGTNPSLSSILDEGPFELIYTSALSTNPEGEQQNFLLDSSAITCNVDLVLPFYGFAKDFVLADTLDLDLADALGVDDDDVLTWEDIEKTTIRVIADNGLPIKLEGQAYFADSLNNIIAPMFPAEFEVIFDQGQVDFTLDESDPNYGRVTSSTRKVTDVVVYQQQIQYLLAAGTKKLIISSRGNTNQSSDGEVVKFYPEYNLDLKISAKIDMNINLNE